MGTISASRLSSTASLKVRNVTLFKNSLAAKLKGKRLLFIGAPASGKGTYAKEIKAQVQTLKVGEFIYSKPPNPPTKIKVPEFYR